MRKEVSNYDKEILVLQFLGICMVVLGHTGDGFPLFSEWFPYYSFHMMLFVFISGYLYKSEYEFCVTKYMWKKIKHLVLPFYMWLLIYGLITKIMKHFEWIFYGENMTLLNFFVYPWTYGCQYSFTAAWWFIPMLFLCQMTNILIRKVLVRSNIVKEYLYLLVSILQGIYAISIARKLGGMYGGKMTQWQMLLLKLMIVLPFFQIGFMFRKYWKVYIDKIPNMSYFFTVILTQLIIMIKYGKELEYGLVHLRFGTESYVVYLVSITGILFWTRISKECIDILGNNQFVKLIGKNTWTVLLHHEIFIFLAQLPIILFAEKALFEGFSRERLLSNYWYVFKIRDLQQFELVYVLIGIGVPVIIKECMGKYILSCMKKISIINYR